MAPAESRMARFGNVPRRSEAEGHRPVAGGPPTRGLRGPGTGVKHPHPVTDNTLSRTVVRYGPYNGQQWTAQRSACHASLMSCSGIALVSRRHVDLCRMSSAICPAS
ncbi:putative leader peptide [Streptomyces sp. NPDC056987]|uniref:putative leader peptide n=1 Tax=Streptomyces sp. NPDC056987 TaxID=3345988 RepID=UPI003630CAE1